METVNRCVLVYSDAFIRTTRTISLCTWALLFAANLFLFPYFYSTTIALHLGTILALAATTRFAGVLYDPANAVSYFS